jgi:endothelin-converting enzyme
MAVFRTFGLGSAGIITIIGFAAVCWHFSESPKCNVTGKDAVCISPACKKVASEILKDLHPDYKNVDPCNDFYQMVCGGFEERHKADEGYVNQCKIFQ